jgi:integrase
MFVQRCSLAPKSCHNLVLTLRMMWSSAKAWGYVSHDPFEGLVLPKIARQARFFFTLDEIQRIIAAASGPLKSFYWLAAETGMRAGELCGLRIEDVDLGQCFVNVKQSVWRGKLQTPKTANSIRQFAISQKLASHLRAYLSTWRPNPVEFGVRHQERNAVGSESSGETEAAPAARIPRDSALRASCIPTHKREPDGQAQCTHEDTPGAIRARSRVEPHAWHLHSRR